MWLCESTMPGISVLPARSTVVAPAGIDTWPAAPTATIFPSWTTSVPFSIAAPVDRKNACVGERLGGFSGRREGRRPERHDDGTCRGRENDESGMRPEL